MAAIIQEEKSAKGAKKRPKKGSAHIDMTPMVDLMCLLITFFMLTTAFSKPKVMEITMPEKVDNPKPDEGIKIPAARTFNILLTEKNGVYWYNGVIEEGKPIPQLIKASFDDKSPVWIRKMLLSKNKTVFKDVAELKDKVTKGVLKMEDSTLNRKIKEIKKTSDKNAPIILIKANDKVKYKNMVDIIDEMAICNIGSYAVVDMDPKEQQLIDGTLK
jgi:biopolymer transport protein ExbD